MSWIVQNLLKNKTRIRAEGNIDSDEFVDLITVENKIKHLKKAGVLSDYDMDILEYVSDGKPISLSKDEIGKIRQVVSKDFNELCTRIAYYLGGYFTDEGYVNYMRKKYNLNENEIQTMNSYMQGKYRYKIMRKK